MRNAQCVMKIFVAALILAMSLMPRTFAFTINGAEVEQVALAAVEQALAERGETRRHEIYFTNHAPDLKLPEGVVDIKANLPAPISYVSLTPVRATVFVNGRAFRTVSLTANVKVYDTVLVASHDLRIEIPVTAEDFRLSEVAIDGRNEYIKDVAELEGLVPHRFIRGGTPVNKGYFQQPVAVNSGQRVNIIINYNGIKVSAKGIVMTRGRIGSLVKVKNETSEKILTAKVIDAYTVEVSM
ncbi:MAG: flagellar basal body P-ring formation protein FlgA [Selenomonadaceae bacterium]|nr:flagellar basal body P-ring formation protein FlgA [Selenomonadaceae bacterium]